jgi:hypothetical protein
MAIENKSTKAVQGHSSAIAHNLSSSGISAPAIQLFPGIQDDKQKEGETGAKETAAHSSRNNAMEMTISDRYDWPAVSDIKPFQLKENNAGLPDNIKTGVENLSGFSMDDVKVHYNSDKPAQLNAFAYAQGTDIHVAAGQEKHLPHEAWHIVQQKQGRVGATLQMKQGIGINDDPLLEKEADVMGAQAVQMIGSGAFNASKDLSSGKKINNNLPSTKDAPIQAKVGFEFEMLILVDKDGSDPGTGKNFYNDGNIKATTDHSSRVDAKRPGKPGNYSSIVELVTFPSETNNATEQLGRINTLVDIAQKSEAAVNRRIPLSQAITGGKAGFYIGHDAQPAQTTDASFQANVGVDIAEIDKLLALANNDNRLIDLTAARTGYTKTYGPKPSAKARASGAKQKVLTNTPHGTPLQAIAQAVPGQSARLITALIETLGASIPGEAEEKISRLKNFKGLLSIMLLYMQLGKTFTEDTLDKNLTQFLSRTNLGTLFTTTLTPFEIDFVQKNNKVVSRLLLEITGRGGDEQLLRFDNSQYPHTPLKLTVGQFVEGVILHGDDGFTSVIENKDFVQYGPDPVGRTEEAPTQAVNLAPESDWSSDKRRKGPVVEIRHTENPAAANKRFPKQKWVELGTFFIDRINLIHGNRQLIIDRLINNLQSMIPSHPGVDEGLAPASPPSWIVTISNVVKAESDKIQNSGPGHNEIMSAYLKAVAEVKSVSEVLPTIS